MERRVVIRPVTLRLPASRIWGVGAEEPLDFQLAESASGVGVATLASQCRLRLWLGGPVIMWP